MNQEKLMNETIAQIEKLHNLKKAETFEKGKFYITAETSTSITPAFLISALRQTASKKIKCGFITTEKNEAEIGLELLSNVSGVPYHKIKTGCNAENLKKMEMATKEILDFYLEIVETPSLSHFDILDEIKRLKEDESCEIIFIESIENIYSVCAYFGDLKDIDPNETKLICSDFMRCAKELDIPIVASISLSPVKKQRLPVIYAARKNCDVFMFLEHEMFQESENNFFDCCMSVWIDGGGLHHSRQFKFSQSRFSFYEDYAEE